jgi:hypothetical protein
MSSAGTAAATRLSGEAATKKRIFEPPKPKEGDLMFQDGRAKKAAQLSAAMLLSALMACAGTKINTPAVESGGTKVGVLSVETAPENKQTPENKEATQAKQATETKQREEPKGCPRCQRIAERLALDENVLSDANTGREFKAFILKEMHLLNQQREHCWKDECATTISHGSVTHDATSATFSSSSR